LKYQKRTAEENEAKILTLLVEEPATFTELLHKTGLSRATLTQHLKNLSNRRLIKREYDEERRAVIIKPNFAVDFIMRGELPPNLREKFEIADKALKTSPDTILNMPPEEGVEFLDKWFVSSLRYLTSLFIFALAPPIMRIANLEREALENLIFNIMKINLDLCKSKSEAFIKSLAHISAKSQKIAEYLRMKALSILYEEI